MKTQAIISLLAIFLASCAPVLTPVPISTATDMPQPTATIMTEPTATATATPVPAHLSGLLFLDANGSGLRDDASFICIEANSTPTSLGYFFLKFAPLIVLEIW
jgi:hypothetical protein